jgi:radical SAM protein with 4Fe4S-binding SPASM domain
MNSSVRDIFKKIPCYKRVLNYIRDRNLYHQLKSKKPFEALIETTNHCNLHCPMCYTHQATRKKGFINLETYKRAIEQCCDFGIENVHLYTIGEPLLHKNIIEMVRIAKDNDRKVYIYTNGMLLDKKMAKQLVDEKVDNIIFSLEGVDKNKYENIRKGAKFEIVKENISNLKQYRNSIDVITNIEIWSIIMDEDSQYLNDFKNYWSKFVDRVYYVCLANQGGYIANIISKDGNSLNAAKRQPCATLWQSIIVLYNGDVSACCVDFEGKLTIGNIYESTLKKIWYGKKHRIFQGLHIKKRFNEISPCDICDAGLVNIGDQLKKLNNDHINIIPRVLATIKNEENLVG